MAESAVPTGGAGSTLNIIVCRIEGAQIDQCALQLSEGATVGDALAASGFLPSLGIDLAQLTADAAARRVDGRWAVAVYGRRVGLGEPLFDHDRVELLAPVVVDPKVARQRRAEHRRQERGERRWARDRAVGPVSGAAGKAE
jgi:putative ubiquitin-RnfH superfamily antitoxin RatB of RatAB toxin-antitoxin module